MKWAGYAKWEDVLVSRQAARWRNKGKLRFEVRQLSFRTRHSLYEIEFEMKSFQYQFQCPMAPSVGDSFVDRGAF